MDFTKIADGTVGRAELSANSIDGAKIADGSVGLADLASPVRSGGWTFLPITDVPVAGLGCRNPTNAPVTMSVGRASVGVVAVPR